MRAAASERSLSVRPHDDGTPAVDRGPGVLFMGVPMAINVRDVLRSEAFEVLRTSGAAIHLFTPAADVEEFEREFGGPRVRIHALRAPRSRLFRSVDAAVLRLHVALLSLRCDTARIMVEDKLRRSRGARWVRQALRRSGRRGQDTLLAFLRRITLWTAPELYGDLFARYRPDLVVGTRVLTMSGPGTRSSARYLDRHLLLSARRHAARTMVLVSSWDNLTTSGFFPVEVDRITVWNDLMKEQAIEIHGLPAERVVVTGAPQHDIYAREEGFRSRDDFIRSLGMDPARPLVVYTTGTEGTIPREPELIGRIEEALRHRLGDALQLLVRVHQLDRVERYEALRGRSGVFFDHAGRPAVGGYHDRDFDREALEHLADTLRHADVVLNAASSISIDAAAVGTPVVVVDFDADANVPYHRSVSRFYDFTHQQPIVRSGGVARTRTPDEAAAAVVRYLEDPSLDREGRERLVAEQCHSLDGRAGRRVGEAVLRELSVSAAARALSR